jgi:hypothetical protein
MLFKELKKQNLSLRAVDYRISTVEIVKLSGEKF